MADADLTELQQALTKSLASAGTEQELQQIRQDFFGKQGKLSLLLKDLGKLPPDERAKQGALLNEIKTAGLAELNAKAEALKLEELNAGLQKDTQDLSLPKYGSETGGWHPVSSIRRRIERIFNNAGYETVLGPELESDYYNFEALNFPPLHPARSQHDTFYFADGSLLRTHTSPGQVRSMESKRPPIKIICPGKTYRCDYDATHSPMFHQVEGMLIDKGVRFTDLKGTLQEFINSFFGREMKLRFRASYFPFTEPSAEVDLLWAGKKGKGGGGAGGAGNRDGGGGGAGKGDGKNGGEEWLEILGCGMVHPNVLRAGGIDPKEYSGFAFGLGVERMAMLYYGINDLRLFYENDGRFLSQFA